MKAILLAICLLACGCEGINPQSTERAPVGRYEILEYGSPGTIKARYKVDTFTETSFPRSVQFQHGGKTHTLTQSYQINETLK